MKKILLSSALFVAFAGVATGSSINGDYKGNPIVKVNVNGKIVDSEIPAQIIDGSTLLPLRAVSEAFGANVKWDQNTYSVDVTMPKSDNMVKQYAIAADFCVYLEHSTNYVNGFATALNAYSKGNLDFDQTYAEYSKNFNKINEVYQKAKETVDKSQFAWGNINTYISELYTVNDLLVDAYKSDVAYRTALSQGQPADISNGLFDDYSQKSQSATDRAVKLIENIRSEYTIDINKVIQ